MRFIPQISRLLANKRKVITVQGSVRKPRQGVCMLFLVLCVKMAVVAYDSFMCIISGCWEAGFTVFCLHIKILAPTLENKKTVCSLR